MQDTGYRIQDARSKKEDVMKRSVLSFCFGLLFTSIIDGQTRGDMESLILRGKEQIQEAEDSWDLPQMLGARAFFERLLNDPTYPWLVHYYIGFVDVRLFNYYFLWERGWPGHL